MKKLIYLLFISTISISSCKKDDINKKGVTITVSEDITSDKTWFSENTYIIQGNIDVNTNAVLTIEAGTLIKFEESAELLVAYQNGFGAIRANGTNENPILFTSNSSIKGAGDWHGIFLYSGASGTNFEHCHFEYGGGYSDSYGMVNIKDTKVGFKNCSFSNSASYGLFLNESAGLTTFENNSFDNSSKNPISIYAKYLHQLGTGNTFTANKDILVLGDYLDVAGNFTWKDQGAPYTFKGSFRIGSSSGTTINIAPGTEINMSSDSEILVAYSSGTFGVLKANGTPTNPIKIGSASPYPAAGDWWGIFLYEGTGSGTTFEHCTISFGGGYSYGGNIILYDDVGANVNISNSKFSYSEQYGIYRYNTTYTLPVMTSVDFDSNTSGDYN